MTTALLYALVAGAASVAGALVVVAGGGLSATVLRRAVALAAGFLVAIALSGLLPEAVEASGATAGWIALGGFLLVHLVQYLVGGHAPHGAHGEGEAHVSREALREALASASHDAGPGTPAPSAAVAGVAALGALAVHTLLDGVAMASAREGDARLGALVFIGVLLHKFPEGLAVSSLLMAAGMGKGRAVLAAVVLAVAVLAGVLLTGAVHPRGGTALAISAGVTLYVGASMLLPEVRDRREAGGAMAVLLGAALAVAAQVLAEGA